MQGNETRAEKKFDLGTLQNNYFKASKENIHEANIAIKTAQNWVLILGLAEMSFLGVLLLQANTFYIYTKIILSVLLLSFILFIIGSIRQYKHVLSSARYYKLLSDRVWSEIKSKGKYTENIPQDLENNRNYIKSNKVANILLFSAFMLIVITTVALIPFIFLL